MPESYIKIGDRKVGERECTCSESQTWKDRPVPLLSTKKKGEVINFYTFYICTHVTYLYTHNL